MKIIAKVLAALAAVLYAAGLTGCGHHNHAPPKADVQVIHVDGIDADHKMDDTITVPTSAVNAAKANLESDLKDETPAVAEQAAPGQLADQQALEQKIKDSRAPLPTAGASQGFQGCRTSFVRNQSSRNGVRPIWQVDHYTVSPNRPGWSDVDAIVAQFNNPAAQASSHFVIDGEGHCAYIVPIEAKSWTEAAGNSLSVGYEIINSGAESVYLAPAGLARLKQVQTEVARRTGIPLRRGSVYPAVSGIVQHKDGGLPWGGHTDITPFSIDQIVKIVTAPAVPVVSSRDRSSCRKVHAYRQRPAAKRTRGAEARQAARKRYVAGHRLTCKAGKAVPA